MFLFSIVDKLTGKSVSVERNGGMAVNIQDQHTQIFDILFEQTTNTTTLSSAASKGDKTLTLTSVTGFEDTKEVILLAADGVIIANQVGAASGNDINIDTPLPYDIASDTVVFSAIVNMNVDGSSTSQSFKIGPIGSTSVDVTNIAGVIQDATAMDGGTFGGLTALTEGIVFRHYDSSEDTFINIWNAKTNGDLKLISKGNADYDDKGKSGSYQFNFVYELSGQENHGVTIRLDEGDYLEILIQDDLTGLTFFQILMMAHLVTD